MNSNNWSYFSTDKTESAFGSWECPVPEPFFKLWSSQRGHWKQVHETRLVEIKNPGQKLGNADAFYSTTPQLPVAVMTADCIPILMETTDGSAVMAIHAGWRGVYNKITGKCLSQLPKYLQLKPWTARLGPSIQGCCFEVGSDLYELFRIQFFDIDPSFWSPKTNHIDLHQLVIFQLKTKGITSVDRIPYCTKCSESPRFHSHRRQPDTGRQFSIIQLK